MSRVYGSPEEEILVTTLMPRLTKDYCLYLISPSQCHMSMYYGSFTLIHLMM